MDYDDFDWEIYLASEEFTISMYDRDWDSHRDAERGK